MNDFKIILFLCNWAPHTAYQTLQDNGYRIPPEVKMVRVSCAGRISKALLFKSFEMGADGVALVGCSPGACRYGTGTVNAVNSTEDIRNLLDLLGLGKERMRFATFLPDESGELRGFLTDFCENVKKMGKSPILPTRSIRQAESGETAPDFLADILKHHDAYACQDCGKCTSSCPLALSGKTYSPRTLVSAIAGGNLKDEQVVSDIWACLTCGLCYERCPSDVNFPEFIRDIRCGIAQEKRDGHQAHGGFFQSLMRAMTSGSLKPERANILPENVKTDPQSKILFFGGCAPYFDVFFRHQTGVNTSGIIADSLRLLNFFDVFPRVLAQERCCGHDLLWSGDRENFLRLAKLNTEMMQDLGIEEVITACPECYRTLALDYEKQGVKPGFRVRHIYEFLEQEIDKSAVTFKNAGRKITYQDSCRLNRMPEIKDLPRKLLTRMANGQLTEMRDSGNSAICCGNCAWTGCDAYTKSLQVRRIRQAHDTGSDLMITSCPKCQIHLRCAMEDPFLGKELKMEMTDLTGLIAQTIRWE